MREAVKQLEARLGERRSRTEIVLDLEARLRLDADRTLLSQALANLLDNAVETHAEGPIHLRIAARAERGSFVRIDVSDRGAGMTEEQIAELDGPYTSTKPGAETRLARVRVVGARTSPTRVRA